MLLYKYSDWNNEYTKENLKHNRLYFNIATNFNDPFDMYPSYQILKRKIFNIQQRKYLQQKRYYKKRDANIQSTVMSNKSILKTALISMRYNKNLSKYGITCFSEDNANMLMWSHYASNHSGICLGFDIPLDNIPLFLNNNLYYKMKLLNINYTSTRPILPLLQKNLTYENILPIFRDKNSDWQYEKEHRLLLLGSEKSFPSCLTYNPQYLKEVILGANMNLNNFIYFYEFKKSLQNLSKIKISIMTLNDLDYTLKSNYFDEKSLEILYNNLIFLKEHLKILYNNFIILETNLPHPKKPKNIPYNKLITIFNILPLNVILTICNLFSKNILTKKMISQLLSKKNSLIMQIYDFLKIIEAQA